MDHLIRDEESDFIDIDDVLDTSFFSSGQLEDLEDDDFQNDLE